MASQNSYLNGTLPPAGTALWTSHRMLAQFNLGRLEPQLPKMQWRSQLQEEYHFKLLEGEIIELERAEIAEAADGAPFRASEFVKWFEELRNSGPGQNDPLFDWLAESATLPQMTWFIQQEVAGEAGFDDLTALTQIKFSTRAKLEMARNYWDEMGRGQESGMHGPMLTRVADELKLKPSSIDEIVSESLALANLLVGLATNRRYAYHSVGALGVIELTAPERAHKVYLGLKRLGLSSEGQRYYLLHSTLDKRHFSAWSKEILETLVTENPSCANALAEGALMRLNAGARCFERYRRVLWSRH
jgi:hypothetical protein